MRYATGNRIVESVAVIGFVFVILCALAGIALLPLLPIAGILVFVLYAIVALMRSLLCSVTRKKLEQGICPQCESFGVVLQQPDVTLYFCANCKREFMKEGKLFRKKNEEPKQASGKL